MAKEIEINLEEENNVSMEVKDTGNVEIGMESDFGGTTDYNKLKNKPSINGVTLEGNKTLEELGIINYDDTEIKENITEIEKENTYQNKRLEYLEKNQIQAELKGEDTLTITDGAFAYANILKETEIEESGEKRQGYEVTLPQGLSKQEGSDSNNLYNYKDTVEVTSGYSTDEEGWITITYDNTQGSATRFLNYYTNNLNLKPSTNYNIIAEIKSVTGNGTLTLFSNYGDGGQMSTGDNNIFSSMTNNSIIQKTATTRESFENVILGLRSYVYFNAGQSGSITFRISVLEDTTITTENFIYKPFPPTIEYPSEIENVKAWNLIDVEQIAQQTQNVITTFDKKNGWLTIENPNSNMAYVNILVPIEHIIIGKTYSLKVEFKSEEGCNVYLQKSAEDYSNFTQGIDAIIKNTATDTYMKVLVTPIANQTVTVRLSLAEEQEKIEDKPYAPYGTINIGLENKNKINLGDFEDTKLTVNVKYKNNKITLNGTTSNNGYLSQNAQYSIGKVKAGTYTFQFLADKTYTYVQESSICQLYLVKYENNVRQVVYEQNLNNLNGKKTFTLEEEKELFIELYATKSGINFNNLVISLQLEKGSETTEIVEHQEQNYNLHIGDLELNGIGDIRDSFVVEVDNSYSYKKVKKLYKKEMYNETILDGINKNFPIKSVTTSNNLFITNIFLTNIKKPTSNSKEIPLLCNYFKSTYTDNLYNNDIKGISIRADEAFSVGFGLDSPINTVELANAKLKELNTQGNPLKILYPLETPELIDLTETYPELVQDIENIINNMFTYEEVTHIDTPIGYLELTYTKSNKLIIKNYDDRISALEQAILSIGGQNV